LLCAALNSPRGPAICTAGPARRARSGTNVGRLLHAARLIALKAPDSRQTRKLQWRGDTTVPLAVMVNRTLDDIGDPAFCGCTCGAGVGAILQISVRCARLISS
jgi:hypothetical protein